MASQVLAVVGAIGLAVCVGCLITLHLVPGKVQPVHDPVSLYGTTRYHLLYRTQAVASGICALCLVFALAAQAISWPVIGLALLACYGVSRILIAGFMMDVPSAGNTRAGRIHILLAAITFTSIAVAVGVLTGPISRAARWSDLSLWLTIVDYMTIIAALLFILVRRALPVLWRIAGLLERGIYLGALCWLGLVIIPLIH